MSYIIEVHDITFLCLKSNLLDRKSHMIPIDNFSPVYNKVKREGFFFRQIIKNSSLEVRFSYLFYLYKVSA